MGRLRDGTAQTPSNLASYNTHDAPAALALILFLSLARSFNHSPQVVEFVIKSDSW